MTIKRLKGAGYFAGFILAAFALAAQSELGVMGILIGTGIPLEVWTLSFFVSGMVNLYIGFHPRYDFNILFFIPWAMYTVGTLVTVADTSNSIPWISGIGYTMLLHSMLIDSGVYEFILQIIRRFMQWLTEV